MDALRQSRETAGLTTRQLAERLHQYQSYVSKIETGERRMDPVEFVEWAKATGITPHELLDRFLSNM